jgi:hypothetical protein
MNGLNLKIRNFKKGDEEEIIKLFNLVFNQKRTLDYWNWEFFKNPFGKGIIFVGEVNNKIVASLSLLPFKFKVNDNVKKFYKYVDAMVHPLYRKQGIFDKIVHFSVEKAKEISQKNEIDLLYSFPILPTFSSALKYLGSFSKTPLKKLIKIINEEAIFEKTRKKKTIFFILFPFVKLFIKIQNLIDFFIKKNIKNEFKIVKINFFDKEIDDFWQKASLDYPTILIRNQEYLNWRYLNEPGKNYEIFLIKKDNEIKGYTVLKKEKETGIIFDIFTEKNKKFLQPLVSFIIDYFKKKKVLKIVCFLSDNDFISLFKKNGFIKTKKPSFLCVFKNLKPEPLGDIKNWFLTYSDLEL